MIHIHTFICNVWSHATDPFSKPFENVFIVIVCPGRTNSLYIVPLLSKNKLAHSNFLWSKRVCSMSLFTLPLGVSDSVKTIKIFVFANALLLNCEVFSTILAQIFRMCIQLQCCQFHYLHYIMQLY